MCARKVVIDGAVKERDFFGDVMDVVRRIPKGRVTSYGAIAKYLGAARSSRMVGYCMNNAHGRLPPIPAHRVVNRVGMLTGKHHFSSPDRMRQLLEREGIVVVDDRIKDFSTRFWDPSVELAL